MKSNEHIALRTSKGAYILGETFSANPLHRFYWGLEAPIWNDSTIESAQLLAVKTVHTEATGHPAPVKVVPEWKEVWR